MAKKKKPERLVGNKSCTNCELFSKSSNVCIMGKGVIPARIMVVLDSPDLKEADLDVPIAGKNLNFLEDLFEKAGIPIEECYITTAIKCGIPKGHKIKVKEINACREYLEHEIEAVRPHYILTLGATSLKALIGAGKITEIHGSILSYKDTNTKVMPVFSPGIAWRDPQKLDDLMEDLRKFNKMINGATVELPKMNFEVVKDFNSFNKMVDELKEHKEVVSWDIETTGLDRFNDDITVMGFGLQKKQWVFPISLSNFNGESIQTMMEILTSIESLKVTTHNGKFDNLFSRTKYERRFNIVFDSMIAAYILDENTPNGLKYVAKRVFGIPDWDLDLDTKKGKNTKEELYEYLAYDLYYTRKLYLHFRKELKVDEAIGRIYYNLMLPAFLMYENVQWEGVYINEEQFNIVDETLLGRLSEVDEELEKLRVESGYDEPVNWGSTKQLAEYLFGYLKLPVMGRTATGNISTAGDLLEKLKDKHPTIQLIIERKGIKQMHSFFINGWKKKLHKGKLYPNFNIHTVVTGRTSSNGPNLQQVPRDKRIRTLVGAPPGWTLAEIDYSQVELRIAGHHSRDPKMLTVFTLGKDIHTNTAVSISGKSEDKITQADRKNAKPVNFGFLYGMGWFKFVEYAETNYGVVLTDSQAKQYRQRFFEEYAELPPWHDKQRRIVRAYKQVRNLIGRLRRLPDIDSPDKSKVSDAERQAINSPIQSLASDIMLMALIEVDRDLPKEDTRIIGSVHDAGLFIIRNDKLNERIPQIKAIMESPKLFSDVFKAKLEVPLVADVEIGDWGAGVEWNGEEILVDEEGNIELKKKVKKKKKRRYYFYFPGTGEYLSTTSKRLRNKYLRDGCDELTRKEYMRGKKGRE